MPRSFLLHVLVVCLGVLPAKWAGLKSLAGDVRGSDQAQQSIDKSAGDVMVAYLEQYHRLDDRDVEGRLKLADWCAAHNLLQQQAELLTEVLKLHPDNLGAYRDLLAVDAKCQRPVDPDWAAKLQNLLGPGYRLYHSPRFTILSSAEEQTVRLYADAMEDAYRTFFKETVAIGLRPLPPPGRLVCVLFVRHEDYRDYLARFEGTDAAWGAGYYSWRTNRAAFFLDWDNPAFSDVRGKIEQAGQKVEELRTELSRAEGTARRIQIQEQIRRLVAEHDEMAMRLAAVSRLTTMGKTRHEATHQLLFNTGLFRRGWHYPFWVNEGLACAFELCDSSGQGNPRLINTYRLRTYRQAERQNALLALSDLLEERTREQDSAAQVAIRYAQAWALVHFLWNQHPERLRAFIVGLEEARRPEDWSALFRRCISDDLADLDRKLRAFLSAADERPAG